jgi:hypothetical protein
MSDESQQADDQQKRNHGRGNVSFHRGNLYRYFTPELPSEE